MDFASLIVATAPLRENSEQPCLAQEGKQVGKNFLKFLEEEKAVGGEDSQLEILLNLLNSRVCLTENEKVAILSELEKEGGLENLTNQIPITEKDFLKLLKFLQKTNQEGLRTGKKEESPVQKMEKILSLEKINLLSINENEKKEGLSQSFVESSKIPQSKNSALLLKNQSLPVANLVDSEEIKEILNLPRPELQKDMDIEKIAKLEESVTTIEEEKNINSFVKNLSAGEQEFTNKSFSFSHELGLEITKNTIVENNFSNTLTQGLKSLEQDQSLPQQLPVKEVPEFILKQIQSNLRVNELEGSSQLTVRLKPESLGKLTLQLQSHNGHVAVKILAENAQVKEFLEQNLIQLRESLNNQGIKSSSVEVQISRDNQFSQFDQSYNPFAQNKGSKKKAVLKEEKEAWRENLNSLQEKYASKGISKVEFLA